MRTGKNDPRDRAGQQVQAARAKAGGLKTGGKASGPASQAQKAALTEKEKKL